MVRQNLFWKIFTLTFLILVVVGFTVPIILNYAPQQNSIVPPTVCQNDRDCYLTCNDTPLPVLCSQNLCQQNSCQEPTLYSYNPQQPITFHLKVEVDKQKINLTGNINNNDFFVRLSNSEIKIFSNGLNLNQVLEKSKTILTSQCLVIGQNNYCRNEQKELKLLVNGLQSYSYGDYIPKENDNIEIIYQ